MRIGEELAGGDRAPFENSPDVEIVAGNWRIKDEPGIARLLKWYYLRHRPGFQDGPGDPLLPSGRSVAIRRAVWEELGGHPEFLYAGEDTLFDYKWRMHGRLAAFAPDAMRYWRMPPSARKFGKMVFTRGVAQGRRGSRRTADAGLPGKRLPGRSWRDGDRVQ